VWEKNKEREDTMTDRPKQKPIFSLKSWLFTPGTRSDRFERAADVHADALIIDLEDAVAPSTKSEARAAAIAYLSTLPEDHFPCALRINAPHTKVGFDDLQALLGSRAAPDYLILPKCDSSGTISLVDDLLKEAGKSTEIIALIETVKAVAALEEMASHHPKPAALLFGAADMAADLGAEAAWEPLLFTRSRIVQVGALTGISPPWIRPPSTFLMNLACGKRRRLRPVLASMANARSIQDRSRRSMRS
jgi:(S)-citramalyl-CoA lyase